MKQKTEIAQAFYQALQKRDVAALLNVLHSEFEGHLTEGLPNHFGGTYRGPNAMLEALRRVADALASRPEPAEFIEGKDHVVVLGHYVGKGVKSQRPFDATFAHVLRFRDGQIAELRQFTDSQKWTDVLDKL
jgi:ketosteroid isomerase-like protein